MLAFNVCHDDMREGSLRTDLHSIVTSWHGNTFCITGHLWGNQSVIGAFPHKRPVTLVFTPLDLSGQRGIVIGHDDVIKWKHFPRNWPFVREIHRSPVNFPHKGQWRGALMFSLIYAWINDWVNNREAGDLRRQHGHYDVIVMLCLPVNFILSTP